MNKFRLILALAAISALHTSHPRGETQERQDITIRIEATEKVYATGEPVRVRVELSNSGRRDLLVGRNLSGVGKNPADVAFQVWDSEGRSLPTLAAASDCVMISNPDSLPTAVLKRWVSLPPNSSYITRVNLPVPSGTLKHTGRYRVMATYISGGIAEQYWNDCLKVSSTEVAQLPYPAWEGKADSNSIWIQIGKTTASK